MRESLKRAAHLIARAAVLPSVLSLYVRSSIVGRDRALENSMQAWAVVPGLIGVYLRRAFLCSVLPACARTATIEFGVLLSSASARIGEGAYIGPRCHLGRVNIERDVLLAAGVHIPSGPHTHGTSEKDVPIRDQPGDKREVRIGAGSWIGSAAIVLADVGEATIVGAGSVVTRPLPDRVIAAGVPARVVRARDEPVAARLGTLP